MEVFKLYFRLLKHYRGVLLMYFAIFLAVTFIISDNMSVNGGEEEIATTKLNVGIIDFDKQTMGSVLKDYFGDKHNITEMEYDKDTVLEELYWRKLSYVLIIPEGFEAAMLAGHGEESELQSMKIPGTFEAEYFQSELELYMSKLKTLINAGYAVKEAQETLMDLKEEKAIVSLAGFVNENQNDRCTVFFLYAPYLFVALGIQGVGTILLHLNEKEVKARMECSSMPIRNRIMGLTAGILLYGCILLIMVLIVVGILSKGSIYGDVRLPYFLLNLVSMLFLGLSLGFLAGTVAKNENAISGIVNVVSLSLCFLGGIFVPQEFFADGITKIARFIPTYWYVKTNDVIGAMQTMNTELLQKILSQTGLVACYALAVFALTVVLISNQRKQG